MIQRSAQNLRSKTIARGTNATFQKIVDSTINSKREGKESKTRPKVSRDILQTSLKKSGSNTKQINDTQSQHSHESEPLVQNQQESRQQKNKNLRSSSAKHSPQKSNIADNDLIFESASTNNKQNPNQNINLQFLLEAKSRSQTKDDNVMEEEINSQGKQNSDYHLSDDSMIVELNEANQNLPIIPKFDGDQKFYTLSEDLYIIALVKRWKSERSKGNPFKERYIEAYTKIRGRTCESIRDRCQRNLKFLTDQNVKDMRKALIELGPESYLHLEKATTTDGKNTKVFKGVFKEPLSVQNSLKNPEIAEKMKKNLQRAKNKEKINSNINPQEQARLERQLIYDDKNTLSNLKKRLYSQKGAEAEEKESKVKQRQIMRPPAPQIHINNQTISSNQPYKSLNSQKTPRQDENSQISEFDLSDRRVDYGTPFNSKFDKTYQYGSATSTRQLNNIPTTKKIKQPPLKERLKWLQQLDKEDGPKDQIQPIKKTKVQLNGKKLRNIIQISTHIQTDITLNDRWDYQVKQTDEYQRFLKQEICIKLNGYNKHQRDITIESRVTPILREKLQSYAQRYIRDVKTVLEDLTKVSGDFKALTDYYEYNYNHLIWLPTEDEILHKFDTNDYQFKVLLHNKGEDNLLKRIKFLGLNKKI